MSTGATSLRGQSPPLIYGFYSAYRGLAAHYLISPLGHVEVAGRSLGLMICGSEVGSM